MYLPGVSNSELFLRGILGDGGVRLKHDLVSNMPVWEAAQRGGERFEEELRLPRGTGGTKPCRAQCRWVRRGVVASQWRDWWENED